MWLVILNIIDKLLGSLGWLQKRSDSKQKKHDEAQAAMDKAAKEGDHDAYWNARARRDRS